MNTLPRLCRIGLLVFAFVSALAISRAGAREFEVVVYNVENLFDVDGVSLFDDYQSPAYGPTQLARKLANISQVLRRYRNGSGPDIVVLCELEADQTPQSTVTDAAAFLKERAGDTAQTLLTRAPLDPALAGTPAWAWLLKQLADDGLAPYRIALGEWRPDASGDVIAHQCAVLTRFPIRAQRTLPTTGARGILEVQLEVGGHALYVFSNHWKSGASDPTTEPVRIGNAKVLRARLDAILRADTHADVILGGDFNSQYNQKRRYPAMARTALDDVLRSQGDETALRRTNGADLYNLWFELPVDKRGSDIFRGEWGTLMQIMITRGLQDFRGAQYVDNSFNVGAFAGLNANARTGRPVRWSFAGGGKGFSDHFPVSARFRTVDDDDADRWIPLEVPSTTPVGPSTAVRVEAARIQEAVPAR